MGLKVYISTVSSSQLIKGQQQKIEMILSSKKIEVEYIDIAGSEEAKQAMRAGAGDTALPPQFFKDDHYLGNYEAFDEAIEAELLADFFQL